MHSEHSVRPAHGGSEAAKFEIPDIREYGALKDGVRQASDRRLFMQHLVFTGCQYPKDLVPLLSQLGVQSVLYLDVNDPRGVGLLLISENPTLFTDKARPVLNEKPFSNLTLRPEFTMLGRTYSLGHEQDLEDWLLRKPIRHFADEKLPWAVWYPLRRKGEFETLPKEEQRAMLWEHGKLGMGYGQAGLANDIRLACHGLDAKDNEFVIGVVAPELYPISKLIQDMRKTQQTSKYIQSMGPFFVGKVFARHLK